MEAPTQPASQQPSVPAPANNPAPQTPKNPMAANKSSSGTKVIIVAIMVILTLCLIAVMAYMSKK